MQKKSKTKYVKPAKAIGRPRRSLAFPRKAKFTVNYLFQRESTAGRYISKVAITQKVNEAVKFKLIKEVDKKAGPLGRPASVYQVLEKKHVKLA